MCSRYPDGFVLKPSLWGYIAPEIVRKGWLGEIDSLLTGAFFVILMRTYTCIRHLWLIMNIL